MSNCYNQPCQWSTDNRTLRGAWTIAFNPSWVSEVMWRFQLFSPCCSHTLEVTTEVTLGWEQHEGKDEQHLPWLDSVIWHGSMAGKRVPQLLLCSGFLWMKGPLVDSLLCGFLPKSCLSVLWCLGICWMFVLFSHWQQCCWNIKYKYKKCI